MISQPCVLVLLTAPVGAAGTAPLVCQIKRLASRRDPPTPGPGFVEARQPTGPEAPRDSLL